MRLGPLNRFDVVRFGKKNAEYLIVKPNVVGIGVGYKQVDGEMTDELAIIVSVVTKIGADLLSPREMIPEEINGIPTDVIQTGEFILRQGTTDRWRPMPGGVSIGHKNVTAGTSACLVRKDEEWFILSNNHVLADSNQAELGDEILQPGGADGGAVPDDVIATLEDFVPVEFSFELPDCPVAIGTVKALNVVAKIFDSRHCFRAYKDNGEATNLVDAAIARPLSEEDVIRDILGIGTPIGIAEVELGAPVKKSGRTTGLTMGKVTQIDMILSVMYPPFGMATFEDQIASDIHSEGGDSGSAVLNENNEVVGLLFAGGEGITVMNRIANVVDLLGVEI